jgi:RNA recognition motif. (a.k.a. RRM, RBD, or RNP domain)
MCSVKGVTVMKASLTKSLDGIRYAFA